MSREELYERVWSTPIRVLAKEFGISDVGLAKRCRALGIPLPQRGYWARREAGQAVERTPLPSWREFILERTRFELSERIADGDGLISLPRGVYSSALRVSRGQLDRALSILDALWRAVEAAGGQVESSASMTAIKLVLNGEKFALSIQEGTIEGKKLGPTGKLTFSVGDDMWADADLKGEGFAEQVIAKVESGRAARADAREKAAKIAEAESIERAKKAEREAAERLEEERRGSLMEQVEVWMWVGNVRAYLFALRSSVTDATRDEWRREIGEFIEWASAYADSIDPTKEGSNWEEAEIPGDEILDRINSAQREMRTSHDRLMIETTRWRGWPRR